MPAPPNSSSTVTPKSPSSPSSRQIPGGKSLLLSISAASGLIRACAKRCTISRSAPTSSPRSNVIEAMNMPAPPVY